MSGVGEKLSIGVGKRDSGKTVYFRGSDELNVEGFFPMYLEADFKILIVDTEDHEKYQDIPVITLEELQYWKRGVYRIILTLEEMIVLYYILFDPEKQFRNLDRTFIIWEDAYKHCQVKVHKILKNFILDAKNRHIGMVFLYHAWAWIPDDLYRLVSLLQVFKTNDSPKVKKDQMPGYYELALAAYEKVMADPLPWATTLVDTGL